MSPSRLYIGKSKRRVGIYGVGAIQRHYVRFGNGMVFEWLMTPYDKQNSRMWQAGFARSAAMTLLKMADYLEGRKL